MNNSETFNTQNSNLTTTRPPNNLNQNSMTNRISSGVQDSVKNLKTSMENIFNSLKGESTSEPKKSKSNYSIFVMLFIISAFILLLYFISNQFRTYKAVTRMKMYQNYQSIRSFRHTRNNIEEVNQTTIASSYNSLNVGGQIFDYLNLKVLGAVLKSGARYLEFEIFNNQFGDEAYPVVSVGHKIGEWKLTFNVVLFENVCEFIAENAFSVLDGEKGVPNPNDPLFIGLNLKTNGNIKCLNLINDYILKYWSDHLLGPDFMNQEGNIAKLKYNKLRDKIILFSSNGFSNSNLGELINARWISPTDINKPENNNLNTILVRIPSTELINFDFDKLKTYNQGDNRLTIIVPHDEYENGKNTSEFRNIFSSNLSIELYRKCQEAKCHFICMNYQNLDNTMDEYISYFKNASIKKTVN